MDKLSILKEKARMSEEYYNSFREKFKDCSGGALKNFYEGKAESMRQVIMWIENMEVVAEVWFGDTP